MFTQTLTRTEQVLLMQPGASPQQSPLRLADHHHWALDVARLLVSPVSLRSLLPLARLLSAMLLELLFLRQIRPFGQPLPVASWILFGHLRVLAPEGLPPGGTATPVQMARVVPPACRDRLPEQLQTFSLNKQIARRSAHQPQMVPTRRNKVLPQQALGTHLCYPPLELFFLQLWLVAHTAGPHLTRHGPFC